MSLRDTLNHEKGGPWVELFVAAITEKALGIGLCVFCILRGEDSSQSVFMISGVIQEYKGFPELLENYG